jgi:hypothetical protein
MDYLLQYCQDYLHFTPSDHIVAEVCNAIEYTNKPCYDWHYTGTEIYANGVHIANEDAYDDDNDDTPDVTFNTNAIVVFEPYIRQMFDIYIKTQRP